MSRENINQRRTWLGLAQLSTLFRLNTGKAWMSSLGPKGVHRLRDGSLQIEAPRPVAIGYAMTSGEPVVGASDLHGWTTIEITPDMVGRKVAVYTSLESKSDTGRPTAKQRDWIDGVRRAGGIAGVVRSPADGIEIIDGWRSSTPPLL